jgi:predicted N-acetyltransferase YhbS
MSSYALEILAACHDRIRFVSGLESVDRYLRETARSHHEKGVSVTRVLVGLDASPSKAVLGYFTLSNITVDAKNWPGVPQGLPKQTVSAVLLGRLAVAISAHHQGIGSMLVATACQLASETIARTGGIGMVVDAADENTVGFYAKYGFLRVAPESLRMFLPAVSLQSGVEIPRA